jgi:hypothetical protein
VAEENTRQVWAIKVLIEAREEDVPAAVAAIERALCPDPEHPGYCPVPWFVSSFALADMDEAERAGWQQDFARDRAASESEAE